MRRLEQFFLRHLATVLVGIMLVAGVGVYLGTQYGVWQGQVASCQTSTENRSALRETIREATELAGPESQFATAMADNLLTLGEPSPICEKAAESWWVP